MRSALLSVLLALILPLALLACGASEDPGAPGDPGDWPAARAEESAGDLPAWTRSMRIWPFDVLEPGMSASEIDERVSGAGAQGADTLIFYVESEHMFGTFVDDSGFEGILPSIEHLTAQAREIGLHGIVYLNGLEVMTRGAFDEDCAPTGAPTMASEHQDWLQRDLAGEPIVYRCQDSDWLEPDWEDAWVSPLSGYRDLFEERIASLADAGVDAIYIDATFLPGFQVEGESPRWGTTDPAFTDAFRESTGLELPDAPDLESESFREFVAFRHDVLAEYLGDLARTARENGLAAFWESSTNDTAEATLLGNETAITGRQGLGFSPEIEPQGDMLAAFRMAKAARELNQERPMIYLGWPEGAQAASIELAIALAHSSTYYPTADIEVPEGAFDFMVAIAPVFERRIAYGGDVALVYSVRNKDWTRDEEAFDLYVEAFESLAERHVPFRIVRLEGLVAADLEGVRTVVLPGLEGISDQEAELLSSRRVALVGDEIGTRDERWQGREEPIEFPETVALDEIEAVLPFVLEAPDGTFIEHYGDREGRAWMALFAVSPEPEGEIRVKAYPGDRLRVTTERLGAQSEEAEGTAIAVAITSHLTVVIVED
ncbi:MAG: hypothetical protein HYY06_05435 [Deltaproteobacteria bacterium]|nr:hypothetical protein [Deltaproteobacteria bacterium]